MGINFEVPKHTLKPREREDIETGAKDIALGHSDIQKAAKETKERPVRQKQAGRESREQKATESGQLLLLGG